MSAHVVVASNDSNIKENLDEFFQGKDYHVTFEKLSAHNFFKPSEDDVDVFIIDDTGKDDFSLGLIDLIRRARPSLPIITISNKDAKRRLQRVKQKGVYYCTVKPIKKVAFELALKALEDLKIRTEKRHKLKLANQAA